MKTNETNATVASVWWSWYGACKMVNLRIYIERADILSLANIPAPSMAIPSGDIGHALKSNYKVVSGRDLRGKGRVGRGLARGR